ncbi:hypothetical protein PACTADRAFT_50534 [Pachysolen tannophilus NRRL Y-2460]|uniref:Tr-type G domain-containing protein n=1 Tax=Pachysolen tannophilus NRRL Y-2460 TaxID=669874 RepID=A0A1E4TSE5_PACTA|nr:hypothetical protein PACTADRAFT_50534 [Pachysolen tannophilus NRRL Y-2460]
MKNANNLNINNELTSSQQLIQERIDRIPISNYRNFVIVAHVDHGKSTLSDRLLELTGVIKHGSGNKQILDKLDVERDRGITVKAQTCSMLYNYKDQDYLLHLVDSPGHVDFRLEVSRSYASCGGALLLVDAVEGIKAQTVSNFYLAYSMNLKLIPVINKVDLDSANVIKVEEQIENTFELMKDEIIHVSAKTGLNVDKIIPRIIQDIPAPTGNINNPFRALIVDSWYDPYLGVVLLIHVVDGMVKKNSKIISYRSKTKYEVREVGIMYPDRMPTRHLLAGQVAYMIPGMRSPAEALIGDTLHNQGEEIEPLPGFEEPKPMVFVGAFPAEGVEFKLLEESMQQLVLNDRSVTLQRETSNALGQGWRLGFLGSLHASVFKERLENEYGAKLIITAPTVPYKIIYKDGSSKIITNPDDFPELSERNKIDAFQEPYVEALMTLPQEYMGSVMKLCEANRGIQKDLNFINQQQLLLKYEIPLSHLIDDFFGKLKSITRGYASLDYEDSGYKDSDIVKLELIVNGKSIDALAQVMHKSQIQKNGKEYVKNFKNYLKIQQFEIIIQARAGGRIVARETIKARKKDVLAKLHASDITRRKKLLVKQKEGKKLLKSIGNVKINNDAYQAFLSRKT